MSKKIIIFYGAPGSGKGTQAQKLCEKFNFPTISTGDLLRHEVKKKSSLGQKVSSFIQEGKLVPDEIIFQIMEKRLAEKDAQHGVIFDGFPRTINQQEYIIENLVNENDDLIAFLIDVGDREVERRLGGRRMCDCGATYHIDFNPPQEEGICDNCGKKLYIRDDDKLEVIQERMRQYHAYMDKMLTYWKNKDNFIKINGEQSIQDVENDIDKEIDNFYK